MSAQGLREKSGHLSITSRLKDLTKTDINNSVKTKKLRGKAIVRGGAGTATRFRAAGTLYAAEDGTSLLCRADSRGLLSARAAAPPRHEIATPIRPGNAKPVVRRDTGGSASRA
jgi:hypothetical protein